MCPHVCPPPPPGVDFKIKTVELRGKKIRLQIWCVWGVKTFLCVYDPFPVILSPWQQRVVFALRHWLCWMNSSADMWNVSKHLQTHGMSL